MWPTAIKYVQIFLQHSITRDKPFFATNYDERLRLFYFQWSVPNVGTGESPVVITVQHVLGHEINLNHLACSL